MARETRHLHRLLPLLDPLLRRPALVVKPHHCPARGLQVGHDEPHSREQLSGMGTPPSPPLVVRSSNSLPGRESPCTTRWACDWAAPPGASAVPRCRAPDCRSLEV